MIIEKNYQKNNEKIVFDKIDFGLNYFIVISNTYIIN